MNLFDEIKYNSGLQMLTEEEEMFNYLKEDFEIFGIKNTFDMYENLFLINNNILTEAGQMDVLRRMEERKDKMNKLKELGGNPTGKGLNQLEPEINQRIADQIKDNSKLPTRVLNNLKKPKDMLPARSPAIVAKELPEVDKVAVEKAVENFKPTITLEDVPKEKQVEFVESFRKAAETNDIEAMAETAKKVIPTGAIPAKTTALAATKSVAEPTSFLGKVWSSIKGFFKNGWEGITKAFQSGNYASLLQIPLVQVGLAVGGTAMAFRIIKAIRGKAAKQAKRV